MSPDINQLTAEIGQAVSQIVQTDLALLTGYSEAKARSIANFTLMIGEAYAAGRISEAQFRDEAIELRRMLVRFVRNVQALAATTAERLIGRLAEVLAMALRRVTGLNALALPVA